MARKTIHLCRHCGKHIESPDTLLPGYKTSSRPFYCSMECHYWSKVIQRDGDECWGWSGAKLKSGYGCVNWGGRIYGKFLCAHVLSWQIANGQTVPKGLCICHKCDNPECSRPDHLFLGTHADNVADKVAKGRQPRGETSYSKLTESQVIQIRADTRPQKKIAADFGICQQVVSKIKRRVLWAHVP